MLIKPRNIPMELQILRLLNKRIGLSDKERQYYLNLEKGFRGEQSFDVWLENLSDEWMILNDLMLENNNTIFQIDTLLISQKTIYMFELKNYEGDFYIDKDIWYASSGNEIKNPLLQLRRSESLLRRILQEIGQNFHIEAYIIFNNPEFTLYQAPLNSPIIFPTQLNRLLKKLNANTLKPNEKQKRVIEKLVSMHLVDPPLTRKLADYDYAQLQKGITCPCCDSFMNLFGKGKLICEACDLNEELESGILRSVEQFKLLFPERKITTTTIHEWCKVIDSKKTVRRILKKHFTLQKHSSMSYFVSKNK